MTTKHTPGPWAHRNGRIYSVDREELTIANVARSADGDYSPANGLLLAAAPELLEALEDLKSELVLSDVDPGYIESHFRPSLNKAAAAIAKALGDRLGQLAAESAIAKAKGEQQ